MGKNIIECSEKKWEGNPPVTLRQLGVDRIVGRTVIAWSANLGTYGMGGPGFFGLQLNKKGKLPKEWLVLILWGADNWLLLDNRWVSAHPDFYHIQKPLWSNFGQPDDVDEVTDKVVNSTIIEAQIEKNSTLIKLKQSSTEHLLELPGDISRLPLQGGNQLPRKWHSREHNLDAWVITRSGDLRC